MRCCVQNQQLPARQGSQPAGDHGAANAAGSLPHAQPLGCGQRGRCEFRQHHSDAPESSRSRRVADRPHAAQSAALPDHSLPRTQNTCCSILFCSDLLQMFCMLYSVKSALNSCISTRTGNISGIQSDGCAGVPAPYALYDYD